MQALESQSYKVPLLWGAHWQNLETSETKFKTRTFKLFLRSLQSTAAWGASSGTPPLIQLSFDLCISFLGLLTQNATIEWLRTTERHSLMSLEARCLNSVCQLCQFLLEALQECTLSLCCRWLPPIHCMPCLADTWLPSLTLSLQGLLPYASVSLYPNLSLLSFIKPQSLNLASALSSMNLSWLYLQKLFLNKVMFMGTRDWDLSMCLGETVKLPITCLLYWASELDFIWLKHSITKIKLEIKVVKYWQDCDRNLPALESPLSLECQSPKDSMGRKLLLWPLLTVGPAPNFGQLLKSGFCQRSRTLCKVTKQTL